MPELVLYGTRLVSQHLLGPVLDSEGDQSDLAQPPAQVDSARSHPADVVGPGWGGWGDPAPALLPGAASGGMLDYKNYAINGS